MFLLTIYGEIAKEQIEQLEICYNGIKIENYVIMDKNQKGV